MGQTNKWDEAAGYPSLAMMAPQEILGWARQGMEFGGHTRTHPHLPELAPEQLDDEIAGSRKDLEELLASPIPSFAYTYGPFSDASVAAARKAYDLAFTTIEGIDTLGTNLHLQRRAFILPRDSGLTLWWKAHMGFDPVARVLGTVRRLAIGVFFGAAERAGAAPLGRSR
jgi:peptidoglycan/xylan/chitin deacetylase (PgdA/CDA1 family)